MCFFNTFLAFGGNFIHSLHGLMLQKKPFTSLPIMIGWGLKSRPLPCQSEKIGLSITSISDYLVIFFFKEGNQLYFVPMHFGSSIWILLPFSKEGCPWVWPPVLRCDGGRKVTVDHVHENASLLPLSCNLFGWSFQFLVICHVISDIFIAVFAWPGPHHALRWVWKKLQVHQEEHLERCKTRFKKIKSQKAYVKKLNEIEDHYLVGLIAVFW